MRLFDSKPSHLEQKDKCRKYSKQFGMITNVHSLKKNNYFGAIVNYHNPDAIHFNSPHAACIGLGSNNR